MPLYDYLCNNCGKDFEAINEVREREFCACPDCGNPAKLIFSSVGRKDWFREGFWEDFDIKPIYVSSKRQLKELCKRYGVYARCLD
jgi:putative FmdB family regulatory protein